MNVSPTMTYSHFSITSRSAPDSRISRYARSPPWIISQTPSTHRCTVHQR